MVRNVYQYIHVAAQDDSGQITTTWEGADYTRDACQRPVMYFLYRFGVLLATNALVHSEFPAIPLTNAYEQTIAQDIVAKLQY